MDTDLVVRAQRGDKEAYTLLASFPGTSEEDLAEQQAIVDSMRIEP